MCSKVIQLYILFHIIFHYTLLQDTEYSSLFCTVGPCCLSVLYTIAWILQSQTPKLAASFTLPFGNHKFFFFFLCFYACESCFCFINNVIYIIFGSSGRESACNVGYLGSIPELGRSPEKGKATHSSILAWIIPWTKEPGRL